MYAIWINIIFTRRPLTEAMPVSEAPRGPSMRLRRLGRVRVVTALRNEWLRCLANRIDAQTDDASQILVPQSRFCHRVRITGAKFREEIEMQFAHLKRILQLNRSRLRGQTVRATSPSKARCPSGV
jgi:hypothetical protein